MVFQESLVYLKDCIGGSLLFFFNSFINCSTVVFLSITAGIRSDAIAFGTEKII